MDFFNHFLGTQDWQFHLAGIIFSLFGVIIAKYHFWKKHQAECVVKGHSHKFDIKFWINDNWGTVLVSLLSSFLFVRFLDVFLHWLNPKIKAGFNFEIPVTEDQIFYYLIAGILATLYIHKKTKNPKQKPEL